MASRRVIWAILIDSVPGKDEVREPYPQPSEHRAARTQGYAMRAGWVNAESQTFGGVAAICNRGVPRSTRSELAHERGRFGFIVAR
jgi:hypothetical protein